MKDLRGSVMPQVFLSVISAVSVLPCGSAGTTDFQEL